jgi:hypothetical protein
MVNLKVLVKAEFDTRNSDELVSAVYSAEDVFHPVPSKIYFIIILSLMPGSSWYHNPEDH